MPLVDHHVKAVVFMLDERSLTEVTATGFIVRWPERVGEQEVRLHYVVTARHCVESAQKPGLRLLVADRGVELDIRQWFHHSTEDVSIARLPPRPVKPGWIQDDEFIDVALGRLARGETPRV
jgi:hypothetical protein